MDVLKVNRLEGLTAYGLDEDGIEIRISKAIRIPDIAVGMYINGYYLTDDDTDEIYFEAVCPLNDK